MERNTNDEGWIKNIYQEYMREVQGVLALSYLFLILIGMINEYMYYRAFGINIFKYSEVFDFLIAPFKRQEIIIFFIMSTVVTVLGYWFDRTMERKTPKLHNVLNFGIPKTRHKKAYQIGSAVVIFVALLVGYSYLISNDAKLEFLERSDYDIEVVFSSKEGQSLTGHEIGANSNYVFLMDADDIISIIPINTKVEYIRRTQQVK